MNSNIFLDFFNRDSRQIFGLYSNCFSDEQHIDFLTRALNVAIFLCPDFCVIPPGFIAECPLAFEAAKRREAFFEERMILWPMREVSVDELFAKKERSYRPHKDKYEGLYDESVRKFLKKYPQNIITRKTKIGVSIAKGWEEGPDVNSLWRTIAEILVKRQIDEIIKIPICLLEQDIAITWAAIESLLPRDINIDKTELRRILQNIYFRLYMQEFQLEILSNIPFARDNFGLGKDYCYYDWNYLKAALSPLGIWDLIQCMSDKSILALRLKPGYLLFKETYKIISEQCKNVSEVIVIFSVAYKKILEDKLVDATLIKKIIPTKVFRRGFLLKEEQINYLDFFFFKICEQIKNTIDFYSKKDFFQLFSNTNKYKGHHMNNHMNNNNEFIAIYVALKMEKDILVNRWDLLSPFNAPSHGYLGGFPVKVFSADNMGRVPAAIATMEFLQNNKERLPKLIIVAGIAGGFQENGIEQGNIIIASKIVDMATRKIRDKGENIETDFRTNDYELNTFIDKAFHCDEFDEIAWCNKAIKDAEWPDGRRPAIKTGPLASLDEVVSSNKWRQELLEKNTQFLGVEMEAGGVCAAARKFKVEVAVIRGISDHADPSKKDDNWRKISMKTIAILLEDLNYKNLCNGVRI